MTLAVAKWIWAFGCIAWFVIRYPHQRRARKTPVAQRPERLRERVLLAISFCGLFVVPLIYVLTEEPRFANYPFQPVLAFAGTVVFAAALALFYRIHRELGRSWSVTLEIRDQHVLVTRRALSASAPSDVLGVLAVGAGAGAVAAKLDRGSGRARRLRHAVLLPGRRTRSA